MDALLPTKKWLILSLTLSLLFIANNIAPFQNTTYPTVSLASTTSIAYEQTDVQALKNHLPERSEIEALVRKYFKDIPILIEIANCESEFRHYTPDGEVIRGKINNQDVGVMQINEKYHLEEANDHDIDIYTLEGNMRYARKLYEKEGTKPWTSSAKCWRNNTNKTLALNTK
ncbi:MAG: hypothetical protein WCW87_03055 [Candidatus Paceibacterota bacterium]